MLPFVEMTQDLMRALDRLEPFGAHNEKPVLLSRSVYLAEPARSVGEDRRHVLARLRHGDHVLKAIGFRLAARAGELEMGVPVDVVYTPRWNVFRGERALELVLHDFRAAGAARPLVS